MSLDFTEGKSTLVQVMAWCLQATSLYLSQCWPRSVSPYGVTRPQWVKSTWFISWHLIIFSVVSGLLDIEFTCFRHSSRNEHGKSWQTTFWNTLFQFTFHRNIFLGIQCIINLKWFTIHICFEIRVLSMSHSMGFTKNMVWVIAWCQTAVKTLPKCNIMYTCTYDTVRYH